MGKATSERLSALLDDAEARKSLLVPANQSDFKALLRRCESIHVPADPLGQPRTPSPLPPNNNGHLSTSSPNGRERLLQPLPGMFARADLWGALRPPERALFKMHGLSSRHPSWIFCGPSAAVVYGLPVTWRYLATIDVATCSRSKKRTRPGVAHHCISSPETNTVNGLPVTSLWRTVFDCLLTMDGPDALAIADAALRMSGGTRAQLVDHLKTVRRGHVGLRRALRIARLADPLSESGGESIARYQMHKLGFACPLLQVWVADPLEPWRRYRVDYLWMLKDGTLIFGEFDGRAKSEDLRYTHGRSKERILGDERLRESRLTVYGARIVRFDERTVRNERQFESLLDSFGVPRRTSKDSSWDSAPLWSSLTVRHGLTVVASTYKAADCALAA